MVLLVLIIVMLVANAVLMYRLVQSKALKPCLAVPTRFVLEYPDCAEKLVQAANVSNVKIVSLRELEGGTSDN